MSTFRDGLLSGRTALMVGGASGINLGIARRYAKLGARVAVAGCNPEKAEAAVRSIGADAISPAPITGTIVDCDGGAHLGDARDRDLADGLA